MKNKKLLFVLAFVLFFLCILSNRSFATVDYFGKQFPDFPDDFNNYEYKVIFYAPKIDAYCLLLSDDEIVYEDTCAYDNISICLDLHYKFSSKIYLFYANSSEGVSAGWFIYREFSGSGAVNYLHCISSFYGIPEILYSNHNIWKYNSTTNEITDNFFYKTPLMHSISMQYTISTNIWQMLMVIIISTIAVVVCFLGLRKGLRTLRTFLQRFLII